MPHDEQATAFLVFPLADMQTGECPSGVSRKVGGTWIPRFKILPLRLWKISDLSTRKMPHASLGLMKERCRIKLTLAGATLELDSNGPAVVAQLLFVGG